MAKQSIKKRSTRRWRKAAPRRDPPRGAGEAPDAMQRLQKILAAAGLGSRRQCEELIETGRVEIDGQPVTELGTRADPRSQRITVDGELVKSERRAYYAVNKPSGVLSTNRDPAGRARVVDLLGEDRRLFTVGRLDQYSDGLIIVTNDGELTQRLTHPRYGVPKTYLVQVAGEATTELVTKLEKGVHLAEGVARASSATIRRRHKNSSLIEMTLTEGRNREIRRMLAQAGHKVQKLTRIAVGPIRLGKLKPGDHRQLEAREVKELRELAYQPAETRRKQTPERPARPKPRRPIEKGEAPTRSLKSPRREPRQRDAIKSRPQRTKPPQFKKPPQGSAARPQSHPLPFLKTGETSEE